MNGIFVKYGKKEHLEQIVSGQLRFSPAKEYIEIEKNQHDKGQGDLLEGKWVLHAENAKMTSYENGRQIVINEKCNFQIGIADVNEIPIFCLSYYGPYSIKEEKQDMFISLPKEKIDVIKRDFKNATHALVILEPDEFIKSTNNIIGLDVFNDRIHYYDYDINDIQMISYLTKGDEEAYLTESIEVAMTYENRYRHLFCKDKWFSDQDEYRFAIRNELIKEPRKYPFKYKGRYIIVNIEDLYDDLKI